MKEISISDKDLEAIAKEVFGKEQLPKYLGNGLFMPCPGMICTEKFMNEVLKQSANGQAR